MLRKLNFAFSVDPSGFFPVKFYNNPSGNSGHFFFHLHLWKSTYSFAWILDFSLTLEKPNKE